MSLITYGFFGEDEGQEEFLRQYLLKMEDRHPARFEAHPWFSRKYQGINNKGVDKGFRDAWIRGFGQECSLKCLFVGRDLDANTNNIRADRLKLFTDKVADIDRPNWWAKTVFILPMQCVEHWLLYLQRRAGGRPSKDTRDLEGLINDTVKKEVYGHARTPITQTKDELVTELAAGMDIDWLVDASLSFQDFHQQVRAYLATLPAA